MASATGFPREWTGLTNFWAAGVEPEAVVLTEAYYKPRAKADLIEVLEGGVIDRNGLPNCQLTAIGLETEAIIACQRACPELGLIYIAVNSKNCGDPIGKSLAETKLKTPELWVNGPKAPSIERQAEKFELTDQGLSLIHI